MRCGTTSFPRKTETRTRSNGSRPMSRRAIYQVLRRIPSAHPAVDRRVHIRTVRPDQRVDRLPDLRVRQDELLWCDKSDEELSERAGDTERYAQNRDVRDCVAQAAAALPCGRFRRSNVGAGVHEPMEGHDLRAAANLAVT